MNFWKSLLLCVGLFPTACAAARGDEVRLVVDPPLPPASARALDELRDALTARGERPVAARVWSDHARPTIVIGLASKSAAVAAALSLAGAKLPEVAEACAIAAAPSASKTIVIAGYDDRGLTYALRDAARAVATAPIEPVRQPWWEALTLGVEQPYLRVRNVSLHPFHAACDRTWFFSEAFWRSYFAQLSLSRFNRCTLTFSDQTNYLCPMYPHFVALPEFPDVQVAGLTAEAREQNVAMLRRIAELADEYAIDFDLGIWMQAPVPKYSADVKVTGLPAGLQAAEFCALGLRRVLEACPSIDGVQLRMNEEAGVKADEQTEFYRPLFQALAAVQKAGDRKLRLDLRYKGLQQATIDAALDEQLDVTVSTKFWSEHLGLPYHPTSVDSHYAADRYSYGTLLKTPRRHRVTYQLWTVGSQRVTLWGDPAYAARFAESCTFGGGEGFEVFAPLTNKGYGDAGPAWDVIADPAYRVGRWEQDRYWNFYLTFGRKGYNPSADAAVWRREFAHRYGAARAAYVADAYTAASRVLPLVTTALLPGASEWSWWPEFDGGGDLHDYARIQTSDPEQFAAVRSWEATPTWRWEPWDRRDGFVEELLAKRPSGRITPWQMSERLESTAGRIRELVQKLTETEADERSELRMLVVDLRLLGGLADYHACKLRAAVHYALFEQTGEAGHLTTARDHLQHATAAWEELSAATDGIYHDRLVFGMSPENTRSKFGHHHTGHWKDRLPELRADLERIEQQVRRLGEKPAAEPPKLPRDQAAPIGTPPPQWEADGLRFRALPHDGLNAPQRVVLHLRAVDQTQPWRTLEMPRDKAAGGFAIVVPRTEIDARFDLQYFFQTFAERPDERTPRVFPDHDRPDRWTQPPYLIAPRETK